MFGNTPKEAIRLVLPGHGGAAHCRFSLREKYASVCGETECDHSGDMSFSRHSACLFIRIRKRIRTFRGAKSDDERLFPSSISTFDPRPIREEGTEYSYAALASASV